MSKLYSFLLAPGITPYPAHYLLCQISPVLPFSHNCRTRQDAPSVLSTGRTLFILPGRLTPFSHYGTPYFLLLVHLTT
jgi:hypothetical protein